MTTSDETTAARKMRYARPMMRRNEVVETGPTTDEAAARKMRYDAEERDARRETLRLVLLGVGILLALVVVIGGCTVTVRHAYDSDNRREIECVHAGGLWTHGDCLQVPGGQR